MRRALSLSILFAAIPALASAPAPVSPVGVAAELCPTFSWAAVPGAGGYELVVYEASVDTGEEPLRTVRLPAGATVWTPPMGECLASGGEYAWVVRSLGPGADEAWSAPALFEVPAAPSPEDVQAALAVLRRHLAERSGSGGETLSLAEATVGAPRAEELARRWRERERRQPAPAAPEGFVSSAAAPSLGAPSLTVDANVTLGAASNVFKDGSVFLWDDTTGNTALGRNALASASGAATGNTAVGFETLQLTVAGAGAAEGSYGTGAGFRVLRNNTTGSANTGTGSGAAYFNTEGDSNTAVGSRALFSNTTGYANTSLGAYGLYDNTIGFRNTTDGDIILGESTDGANNTGSGSFALFTNSAGSNNTALGLGALQNNTTGSGNVAIGYSAGLSATSGNDNVFVLSYGEAGDTATIRFGIEGRQDGTFVAGIRGTTTGVADAVEVLIDSAGQLGTVSSSRTVKQDVRDVGDLSRPLLDLRPVAFRYRDHVARDPDAPLQFGLIAEEVATAFPGLVIRDGEGEPETVKYHLLPPLLLNELQRLHRELAARRLGLHGLRERLDALERGPPG